MAMREFPKTSFIFLTYLGSFNIYGLINTAVHGFRRIFMNVPAIFFRVVTLKEMTLPARVRVSRVTVGGGRASTVRDGTLPARVSVSIVAAMMYSTTAPILVMRL